MVVLHLVVSTIVKLLDPFSVEASMFWSYVAGLNYAVIFISGGARKPRRTRTER